MHFNAFLCISMHFYVCLYAFLCISMYFYAFPCISMHSHASTLVVRLCMCGTGASAGTSTGAGAGTSTGAHAHTHAGKHRQGQAQTQTQTKQDPPTLVVRFSCLASKQASRQAGKQASRQEGKQARKPHTRRSVFKSLLRWWSGSEPCLWHLWPCMSDVLLGPLVCVPAPLQTNKTQKKPDHL